jgi:hypothetical protein
MTTSQTTQKLCCILTFHKLAVPASIPFVPVDTCPNGVGGGMGYRFMTSAKGKLSSLQKWKPVVKISGTL